MAADMVLSNGKIFAGGRLIRAGIAVDEGRIIKIAKDPNLPKGETKIDLDGKLVLPGFVDSHVHLRDQQLSYREDFETGTMAAAAGGVTTVVDMPNNRPLTMSAQALQDRMRLAESRVLVNVAFNCAFPTTNDEVSRIVNAGAVGFKLYLAEQLGGVNIDDDEALLNTFQAIERTEVPVAVHAEDRSQIQRARESLLERGRMDIGAFLEAHRPETEKEAIRRVTELAKKSGARVHVCHVSSEMGLKTVIKAKQAGVNVTCEVTPHHLLLTTADLKKLGNVALEIPPLRTEADVNSLWLALHRGQIDTVGSDHAPHSLEEKQSHSVWDVKPGIAGLETMLPLLLTQVNRGRLSLEQLVHVACERPAEIYRLKGRGSLSQGSVADITVVDMDREFVIDASKFHSKARFSPFDGWKVKGKPVKTFVNGQLVMDNDEIVGKPRTGRIIK